MHPQLGQLIMMSFWFSYEASKQPCACHEEHKATWVAWYMINTNDHSMHFHLCETWTVKTPSQTNKSYQSTQLKVQLSVLISTFITFTYHMRRMKRSRACRAGTRTIITNQLDSQQFWWYVRPELIVLTLNWWCGVWQPKQIQILGRTQKLQKMSNESHQCIISKN